MPKAPSIDTFKITCEVAVHNLGPAMVRLAQIEGLIVTGSELVTTVKRFTQNTHTNHHIKAEAFLEEWLKDHATFRAVEAVNHFKADGRTSGACYTALRVMSADGRLRKLGEGMYSRPNVKALAAPKQAKQAKQARREVPHSAFILRVASRNHGRFNTTRMKAQFEKDGRNPGTVSPTIASMMTKKQIKRVSEGEYVLLNKAAPKKTDRPKLNGPAPAEVEVPANG